MKDDLPNWTEVAQLGVAIFGTGVALWTLRDLIASGDERQKEIKSLGKIASQLTMMMELNERRYFDSIIPVIEVKIVRRVEFQGVKFLSFSNVNPNCRITSFKPVDAKGLVQRFHNNEGPTQYFEMQVNLPIRESEGLITIKYIVNDSYRFKQLVVLVREPGGIKPYPSAISVDNDDEKNEA